MGLPLTTESLDSIDESLRSHYVEENGKFRLDLDGYEDPTNLKSALQKAVNRSIMQPFRVSIRRK